MNKSRFTDKMKKRTIITGLILIFCFSLILAEDLSVDNLFVRVSIDEGEFLSRDLEITSGLGGEFDLVLLGLEGVSLDVSKIDLKSGETKRIEMFFDSRSIGRGVHVGNLKIFNLDQIYSLPIIFEIESKTAFFDLSLEIPTQYREISPGENILAQVKIFDLISGGVGEGLGPTSLNIEYFIYSLEGEVVKYQIEQVVLEKEAKIDRTIPIRKNLPEGDYALVVILNHLDSISTSSELFSVIEESKEKSESSGVFSNSNFIIILVVILLFFFGMMAFFIYLLRDRDKLFLELKKYNAGEIRTQNKILNAQAKVAKAKATSKAQVQKIDEKVKEKRNKLKEKQTKRVKQFKVLKSKGNKNKMRDKLREWKRKGYNTSALEYKLGMLSKKEMEKIVGKWKKY